MILHEILIPMLDRDGVPYDMDHMPRYLRAVADIAGGYSILPTIEGFWKDPTTGQAYDDTMVPVRVAVAEPEQWDKIIALSLSYFADQVTLMHYIVAGSVTFTPTAAVANRTDREYGFCPA